MSTDSKRLNKIQIYSLRFLNTGTTSINPIIPFLVKEIKIKNLITTIDDVTVPDDTFFTSDIVNGGIIGYDNVRHNYDGATNTITSYTHENAMIEYHYILPEPKFFNGTNYNVYAVDNSLNEQVFTNAGFNLIIEFIS